MQEHHVSSTYHFISVMYARAWHHVSSMYHSTSDVYTRAWHYDCSTCHSLNYMHARVRHIQGSLNPRFILGKPWHNSTGLSKPKANTSPIQGLINPRSSLGESLLLLSSISIRTQGTQGLPLTIISIINFYLCRNTSLSKTQGPPWYILLQNPRSTLGKNAYRTQGTPLVRSLA